MVGYPVMSHEAIRQLVLEAEAPLHCPVDQRYGRVLFVEADGLFVSRQGKGKRAKEDKILIVHEGWKRNGSRIEFSANQKSSHKVLTDSTFKIRLILNILHHFITC